MRLSRVSALWLIAVAVACSVATAVDAAGRPPAAPRSLLDAVVASGSPGALVLVDDGPHRAEAASGVAVLQGRVPLRTADRFRAGSITKTFVAVVVLQLVAENRVRLGDTVERWLPGLVPNGARITVARRCSHIRPDWPTMRATLRSCARSRGSRVAAGRRAS